jgi:hypothetical protein
MLRGHMEPDPSDVAAQLSARLMSIIAARHPAGDAVVEAYVDREPGWRKRAFRQQIVAARQAEKKKRFTGHELVKVVTARDGNVCKACLELAAGGPYHYTDIRAQVPHHPGCRCYIARLGAADRGFLWQHPRPTFKQFKRAVKANIFPRVKRRRKAHGAPQRNATIARLRRKGKKFVAPHGSRAVRFSKRKNKGKKD